MITLDLPPQVEMQIIEIAKRNNISVDEYIIARLLDGLDVPEYLSDTDKELFRLTGIMPFKTENIVTNEMVNELRHEYGI